MCGMSISLISYLSQAGQHGLAGVYPISASLGLAGIAMASCIVAMALWVQSSQHHLAGRFDQLADPGDENQHQVILPKTLFKPRWKLLHMHNI
jgi:hypothetical protein